MSDGHIFKRCGCRHPRTRKALGNACPKLRRPNGAWSSDHGVWHYQLELPRTPAGRRQLRRGGFTTGRDATAELDHARDLLDLAGRDRARRAEIADLLLAAVRAGRPLPDLDTIRQRIQADVPLAEAPTVAAYLTEWLAGLQIDENTVRGYESHVRVHLIPHLGHLRLDKLKPRHVKAMFAKIQARNTKILQAKASDDPDVRTSVRRMRPTGPATCQRIRATLRKAINDALAEEIFVGANPAALVKTPADRALPILWEPERVQRWQATGEIPGPVMVWTDDQVAQFLDYAADHAPDLHPMFHFIAYRGPRRGEACGLRDSEVRLGKKEATINNQIATIGNKRVQKPTQEPGRQPRPGPRRRHRQSPGRLQGPPRRLATRRRTRLARHRPVLRPPRRPRLAPQRRQPTIPAPGQTGRAAPHPAARPAPRRRHHGPRRRCRHQSRLRTTRPHHDHPHPRHLPKRRQTTAPQRRRRRREEDHQPAAQERLTPNRHRADPATTPTHPRAPKQARPGNPGDGPVFLSGHTRAPPHTLARR
jgi:hypothetical protein